jgi:hypothetical protein
VAKSLPAEYADAFFELVGYPVEASAAMNEKFLYTDRSYLNAEFLAQYSQPKYAEAMRIAADKAHAAYDSIQSLTAQYNSLGGGKWDGIMSAAPRDRHVFEMPRTATAEDGSASTPPGWSGGGPELVYDAKRVQTAARHVATAGFHEQLRTVSINAAHFTRKSDGSAAQWNVLEDLGISGASIEYGVPGLLANSTVATAPDAQAPWLEYEFTTTHAAAATLAIHLLPTFPLDSDH